MSFSEAILIAEDDEADRFLLQRAMLRAGLAAPVAFVRDGIEALDYLNIRCQPPHSEPPPALLLLDLKMPRMDGFQLLESLRADPALRPRHIAVLSSSEEPLDVRRAAALGVEHYLVKPADLVELAGMIKRLQEAWEIEAEERPWNHPDANSPLRAAG